MTLDEETKEIRKKVKKKLSKERYHHTQGVAYTAACLAFRYGADMRKCYIAGLLHDVAKELPPEELFQKATEWNVPISSYAMDSPGLLHAPIGVVIAREKFLIQDPDILSAIGSHTLGHPNMSIYEKILYVADYIEPNRDFKDGLDDIRSAAFTDIDRAVCLAAKKSIEYLNRSGKTDPEPMSKKTYEFYKAAMEK